jgi:hypothetical protein
MMRLVGYVEESQTGELRGLWLNVETGEQGVSRDLDRALVLERVLSFGAEKEQAS